MAKVKYKDLPESFASMVAPSTESKSRSSVGMESSIGEYYYISVFKLHPYSKQARQIFDPQELEGLAQSIKQYGIRQPLSVVRRADNEFEVISGERRLRAAKALGLEKVPCIVLDEAKDSESIALIENIQRSDLHPLEITEAIISLSNDISHGEKKILADKLGITPRALSEYLAYARIPERTRKELIAKNIRNRDYLRSLFSSDNEPGKLAENDFLYDKKLERRTRSVLKLYYQESNLVIQKRPIRFLDRNRKAEIKEALTAILKELD